jgi:hypothetical protein
MRRGIKDLAILEKFVLEFCSVVEKHVKYIICSGFVAIAHGRTRATEDVDMIIKKLDFDEFERLHKDLVKAGFECMQSSNSKEIFENYLIKGDSVRYAWKDKFLPEMEVKFAKDDLDEEQLENRMKLPLTDLDVFFSSVESNIAFKEELLGAEKDLEDAKHLRIIYEEEINEEEINEIKEKIRRIRYGKR